MSLKNNSIAHETYNIQYWGDDFFTIDKEGYVTLGSKTAHLSDHKIRLQDVVDTCLKNNPGIGLPLLIRFPDIIRARLQQLQQAFDHAFAEHNYNGKYLPAYPIKVNQQRSVVNSFLNNGDFGGTTGTKVALEAGSKPELFIIMALAAKHNLEVICNGYKDVDYIKLALLGQKLGLTVNIIIEKYSELDIVLKEAAKLNIRPRFGVRVRLSSLGSGNWQNTGGVKSKFGLTSLQLLAFLEQLKQVNMLDCLKLLHFHMGSQISELEDIQNGLMEGVRLYAEICRAGAHLEELDVGGGLGVDYEGTSSRSYYSVNYSINSYASTVVKAIKDICDQEGLNHPKIITECGRAMVAHHAVLVTDIIDVEPVTPCVNSMNYTIKNVENNGYITELQACLDTLDTQARVAMEVYYRAKRNYDLANKSYIKGDIHLPVRAAVEQLYYKVCIKLIDILDPKVKTHSELLDVLNEDMANKVFCNFSLFQSVPDIWGLGQVFPILPLSHLNDLDGQDKKIRGLLQDMTCDSDGRIDKYIDGQGVERSLSLPIFHKNKPYCIGFFMVGAYQEILGDLHNLFGDTVTVDVELTKNGFELNNIEQGDLIKDVIKYVNFNADELMQHLHNKYITVEQNNNKQEDLIEFLKNYINKSPYFVNN